MICSHALDLIDAASLVDVTPDTSAALYAHASTCATCGAALSAARTMSVDLVTLPEVTAPPTLASSVDARIAALAAPEPLTSVAREAFEVSPDWRAWLTLGGVAASMAIVVPSSMMSADLAQFSRADEPAFLIEARAMSTAALLLGLALFLALIFWPVSRSLAVTTHEGRLR